MKVIGVDNFGRDYNGGRSEIVAGENLTQIEAELLRDRLNAGTSEFSQTYYVIKPDDYTPYIFNGY